MTGEMVVFDRHHCPEHGGAGDEHPRFDFAYCPPIPAGWREFSWHNDAMPCWLAGPTTAVWVDYYHQALGEWADLGDRWRRYAVTAVVPDPDYGPQHAFAGEAEALLYTDDWGEVLALVASREK